VSNRIHKRALHQPQGHEEDLFQGGTMGIVMIRCPTTGREVSTGIKIDRPTFECSPVFFAQTFCRFCRTEHQWFAKDAWVEESAVSAA
jgi:hypothetical protein